MNCHNYVTWLVTRPFLQNPLSWALTLACFTLLGNAEELKGLMQRYRHSQQLWPTSKRGIVPQTRDFRVFFRLHTLRRDRSLQFTAVSKCLFLVLNSEIQVSFFRKLPLQNFFLKFYSLNERSGKKQNTKVSLVYFIHFYLFPWH